MSRRYSIAEGETLYVSRWEIQSGGKHVLTRGKHSEDPRWGDTFSTEQTNHCSPTCTLIVCGCNDNASPEQSYCLIMMMCSVREKTKLHQRLEKERETSTLPLSRCNYFIYDLFFFSFAFFWIANKSSLFFLFFVFFSFGMKQPLTAHWRNVLEYVEILWALSDPSPVTGIYLWNPSPFPSPPTWADPHLASQWLQPYSELILARPVWKKTLPSLYPLLCHRVAPLGSKTGVECIGLGVCWLSRLDESSVTTWSGCSYQFIFVHLWGIISVRMPAWMWL